jgi:hypothetical protein
MRLGFRSAACDPDLVAVAFEQFGKAVGDLRFVVDH